MIGFGLWGCEWNLEKVFQRFISLNFKQDWEVKEVISNICSNIR